MGGEGQVDGQWPEREENAGGKESTGFCSSAAQRCIQTGLLPTLEKKHLFMEKHACNNGITETELVCPIYTYSILCGIHCLEHHTFRSVVSIREPNLALIS